METCTGRDEDLCGWRTRRVCDPFALILLRDALGVGYTVPSPRCLSGFAPLGYRRTLRRSFAYLLCLTFGHRIEKELPLRNLKHLEEQRSEEGLWSFRA